MKWPNKMLGCSDDKANNSIVQPGHLSISWARDNAYLPTQDTARFENGTDRVSTQTTLPTISNTNKTSTDDQKDSMYNSQDFAVHVGLKLPTAVPQNEIILSDFNFCFSCRTGACPKHEGPTTISNSSHAEEQQKQESTRQGVSVLAQLPVELACQVALSLPSQAFFSIRHIPSLEAFWAANAAYLVREKAAQYAAEAQFFPADLFTGAGGSVLAPHQQLLYLEVIRTCTAAVTDYFTTALGLPAGLSARLHAAVLRLWRVVGVSRRSSAARMRQEAMNDFCSLPQAERADIFALFAEHVSSSEMHDIVASGAWAHVLGYLALENIRAAMRGSLALAAAGCNDVDAAAVADAVDEMRLGTPLWAVWDPDRWDAQPGLPFARHVCTDVWAYYLSVDENDPNGDIFLYVPDGHGAGHEQTYRDDYIAFGLARRLPDGWAIDTRRFYDAFGEGIRFSRNAVGGEVGTWFTTYYKFDEQHASDDENAQLMQALMGCAFQLV